MAESVIDLLRHGEPEGGARFRGHLDDPLSVAGWAQMRGAAGKGGAWDVVVTSPLRRCADFAVELAARLEVPLESDTRLREIGFGAWEGLTAEQIAAREPEALARFWHDPARHAPPGGEALADFEKRVAAAWDELLQRHAGRRVLLVCHGGVIRLILARVLDMPRTGLFRLNVPFASTSRVRIWGEQSQPELVFLNGKMER